MEMSKTTETSDLGLAAARAAGLDRRSRIGRALKQEIRSHRNAIQFAERRGSLYRRPLKQVWVAHHLKECLLRDVMDNYGAPEWPPPAVTARIVERLQRVIAILEAPEPAPGTYAHALLHGEVGLDVCTCDGGWE
jgi:hypothetical protein